MRAFCKKVNKIFRVSTSPELVFLLFFFFFSPESLQARMVITLAALYPLARKQFETRKVRTLHIEHFLGQPGLRADTWMAVT